MNGINGRFAIVAATLAALAGSAVAQSGAGGFDQPLRTERGTRTPARVAQPQPAARSIIELREVKGNDTYEIRIVDGEISGKINGKNVPEDRIRRRGERVELLDENGRAVTSFQVSSSHIAPQAPRAAQAPRAPRAGVGAGGGRALVEPAPPMPPAPTPAPRVMLGINMSDLSESLRDQLALKEGEGVLVTRAIEGLPAHRAGLRNNDVIIGFDGESPVDAARVRQILRDKEPGDSVDVTVRRRGESKKFTIKLGQYDAEALAPADPQIWMNVPGQPMDRERMEQMFRERMRVMGPDGEAPPIIWGPGGEDRQMRFFVPGGAAETKRLEELEARLAEVNARLAEVNRQLERMQRQLERTRNE